MRGMQEQVKPHHQEAVKFTSEDVPRETGLDTLEGRCHFKNKNNNIGEKSIKSYDNQVQCMGLDWTLPCFKNLTRHTGAMWKFFSGLDFR